MLLGSGGVERLVNLRHRCYLPRCQTHFLGGASDLRALGRLVLEDFVGVRVDQLELDRFGFHQRGTLVLRVPPAEEGVHSDLQTLVDHLSDQALEQGARLGVEAGVGVDFDQHHVKVVVDHEVVTQKLELVLYRPNRVLGEIHEVGLLQLEPEGFEGLADGILDLGEQLSLETDAPLVLEELGKLIV